MNIVITGHVDHGKSTVIGRLFAETGTLPEGKLEGIRQKCKREGKDFEYAFLLDALKDEQSQGITIDAARAFFKTVKRDYLIIDAPGHIEFLKNMVTGAARAQAAILVIDAKEGVRENSFRHGYMLSLLGIKQIIVVVNKMDLVDYDEKVYNSIVSEYSEFLKKINLKPLMFLPASAVKGDNIAKKSEKLRWYEGDSLLTAIDKFVKEKSSDELPFRMPVQQVYRFTKDGDDRRIVGGRIESGSIKVGDKIVFLPSNKKTKIKSIEEFNSGKKESVSAGYSTGFTMEEEVYVNRGDIMCKLGEKLPNVSTLLKCNLFWMGKNPMEEGKRYKLRLGTTKTPVMLKKIIKNLDASNLEISNKNCIERHDVAECILETENPIAYDLTDEISQTSRFVIIDGYDQAGGGIIVEAIEDEQKVSREQVYIREDKWYSSDISRNERINEYGQNPRLILITGPKKVDKKVIAKKLERKLFESGKYVYYLGIGNLLRGLNADIDKEKRHEHVRRLGEVSHLMLDSGLIVIATASDLTVDELKLLKAIIHQDDMLKIYVDGEKPDEMIDLLLEKDEGVEDNVKKIVELLKKKGVLLK